MVLYYLHVQFNCSVNSFQLHSRIKSTFLLAVSLPVHIKFCNLRLQVFDKDITQDKRLGIAKLPLIELEQETPKEYELRLLPSLDMLRVKDKKDRGTLTIKVSHLLLVCESSSYK